MSSPRRAGRANTRDLWRMAAQHTIEGKMREDITIQKCLTKVSLRDAKSDFAYWQSQPYLTRLAALEQIRTEYHRWRYGAQPRLQRVYSIVKR